MLPDTRQHKILMIVGPKRSGKGTIARVLGRVIGMANVCGPTLSSLGMNFGLWPLLGKTLAIISDARLGSARTSPSSPSGCSASAARTAQTIDRKNLSQVTCKLAVRFMILTNELPHLNDPSGALVGRLVLLRMIKSWYGREDTGLTTQLLAELPSILLWSIRGWRRLAPAGAFPATQQFPRRGQRHGRPVVADGRLRGRDHCIVGVNESIPVQELYGEWKLWCEGKGWKGPGTEQTFGRDLRAVVAGLDVTVPRDPGIQLRRIRVYNGVRLKTPEEG